MPWDLGVPKLAITASPINLSTVPLFSNMASIIIDWYSDSKAKNLIQRGNSINKIRNYLISKGIKDIHIQETINTIKEKNENQDFFSAIKICKKKRIGPARNENNRPLFYKKDLSLLARLGFDFETSKKVMEIDQGDYLRIINFL